MLITFSCSAYANITMFGDQAITLIKSMGHSGNVPGTILASDISASLKCLENTIAENAGLPEPATSEQAKDDEPPVSLAHRALPLIELLKAAEKEECNVMWDASSK